jgi:hypothetical protein
MPVVKVSIAIDDAHLDQMQKISQNLQAVGLHIDQTLPTLGIISGAIDSSQIDRLCQIEGVQHIEPDHSYQLPPPNSDIQ